MERHINMKYILSTFTYTDGSVSYTLTPETKFWGLNNVSEQLVFRNFEQLRFLVENGAITIKNIKLYNGLAEYYAMKVIQRDKKIKETKF